MMVSYSEKEVTGNAVLVWNLGKQVGKDGNRIFGRSRSG